MSARVLRDDTPYYSRMYVDKAPPVRVVAVITLFASTLDLLSDFLISHKLWQIMPNFYSADATRAGYFYFVFTGISVMVYIFEMTDVCLTLKNDEENIVIARIAKSLVLALEEVPLPFLLYIIFKHEPRISLASPAMIASCIKLIALVWGIIKFAKLRFCWFCLPLTQNHGGLKENTERCFTPTLYRFAMLIVNLAHILAITLVIINIVNASSGGEQIQDPAAVSGEGL